MLFLSIKVVIRWLCGISKVEGSTSGKNAISKFEISVGTVSLLTASMKVLPIQMRWPPKKGAKLNVFLALPAAVRK